MATDDRVSIRELAVRLALFARERDDWDRFHSPKKLVDGLGMVLRKVGPLTARWRRRGAT